MIEYIKKAFQKYAGNSTYKKNVLLMVIGRVLSQAIPILLTPLFSRIYFTRRVCIFAVITRL